MDEDIRLTRQHHILGERETQLLRNLMAVEGGKPYIDERLTRFPSESETSWLGNEEKDIVGRKDRAFNINYPKRITTKLIQYVFGQPITRDGGQDLFLADVTRTGDTASEFMEAVCEAYTASGWCWVSVDRGAAPVDAQGNPVARSVAQREASGDRVYWILWNATEVVDWHYSAQDGKLDWLITQTQVYDNSNPLVAPGFIKQRDLWMRGGNIIRFRKVGDDDWTSQELTYTGDAIPFHMVGKASPKPHWFDEVEILQAAVLNLHSADFENINQAVFPQLVLPAGTVEWAMAQGEMAYEEACEMMRGLKYPLFEPGEDKGVSRFIQPSGFHMKTIPEKLDAIKKELFDVVGLAMTMGGASKQVQSAESKRWDHLDPEATLKSLAGKLEAAEAKLVEFSKQLDSTFTVYEPAYPRKFDIEDAAELTQALLGLSALPLPPEADKELQKAAVKVLGKVTPISAERQAELAEEIEAGDVGLRGVAGEGDGD